METSMTSRLAVALLSCLLTFTLAGCSKTGGGGGGTNIRVVNAVPDAAAINVTVGDTTLVTNLAFQGLTQYQGVGSGNQEFKVSANGGTSNAIDTMINLSNGANYTYVVFNPVTSATALLIVDSGIAQPASGTFSFRVINVASGIGPVDVYLTAAGTDLNSTSPTVAGAVLGGVSAITTPNSGTLELRVTSAGTKDVIYDTPAQNFADQSISEVVIFTVGSSRLVNAALLNVDDNGTGQVNNNLLAEFKVLNASQVASPLNVLVDGNLTLSNVPYAGVSNYVTANAGSRSFAVQATATPGANLLSLVTTLGSATDTSIVLNGPAGALVGTVLTDNNLPPALGRARIRFVNSSPDLGPVDVYVNFSKQVSTLATNNASAYIDVTADATLGTAFEFDFNLAGTTTPVLKLPNTTIIAAHVYSIYVIGLSTALQGVVVKDH
jgi:hypothetical protein